MFRYRMLVLLALVWLLATGAAAQDLTIEGQVVDSQQQPVAGAEVTLYPLLSPYEQGFQLLQGNPWGESFDRAVTDAQGFYRLEAPEWGLYQVVVEAEGSIPMAHRLAPLLSDTSLSRLTLTPDEGAVVRVLDAQGKGAAGTLVVLRWHRGPKWRAWDRREPWHPALRVRRTAEDGAAAVPYLPEERLQVAVFHPQHWPWTGGLSSGDAGLDVALRGRHSTRSVDLLEGDSRRRDALVMQHSWPYAAADEAGRVTLPESERLRLEVLTADGQRREITLPAGQTALQLPASEWIRGQVVQNGSDQPVSGAWVWDGDTLQQARTDSEGLFRWPTQGSGPRLRAAKPGLHDQSRPGYHVNKPGADGTHRITLHTDQVVRGHVVDDRGRGIAGATLEVRRRDAYGTRGNKTLATDTRGFFQVHGLNKDVSYRVRAEADDTTAAQLEVEAWPFTDAHGKDLTLTLHSGVALTGRVLGPASQPVEGAQVDLFAQTQSDGKPFQGSYGQGRSAPAITTDADGRFKVTKMALGRHTLVLRADGLAPRLVPSVAVDVGMGTRDLGDLVLEEEATLDLLVLDDEGAPVAEVSVFDFTSVAGGRNHGLPEGASNLLRREGKTNAEGELQLDGLRPGQSMDLWFQHPQFVHHQHEVVASQGGYLEVTLDRGASLRGRVVDASGRGLPDARLSVKSEPVVESQRASGSRVYSAGKSGADGSFEIPGLENRKITILARLDGYQDGESAGVFPDGNDIEGLTVQLLKNFELQGAVVDEDGVPASGAQVSLWHGGGRNQRHFEMSRTGSDGRFSLPTVPGDDVTIEARDSQGRWVTQKMVLEREMAPLTLVLETGQVLSGHVVDLQGKGIEGAEVAVQGSLFWKVESDVNGRFLVSLTEGGRYTVSVTRDDMGWTEQTVDVPEGQSVDDLELVLEAAGRIVGRVSGLQAHELTQLSVSASRQEPKPTFRTVTRSGRVDLEGALTMDGITAGTWHVSAQVRGSARRLRRTVHVDGLEDVVVDLDFGESGLTLSGQIFHNGEPTTRAFIYPGSVQTDPSGRFRIEGLQPGPFQLVLSGPWGEHVHTGEIYADDDIQISIDTFELAGQVVDVDGQPLKGFVVQCLDPGKPGSMLTASERGEGRFQIPGLKPGTYRLMAQKPGYGAASVTVELAGDLEGLRITLRPTETVVLTVQGPGGGAVDHLAAVLLDASGRPSSIQQLRAEADGRFLLDFVPDGTWDLLLMGQSSAPGRLSVQVPGGPYTFQLQRGTHLAVQVPELEGDPTGAYLDIVDAEGRPFTPGMIGMPFAQWPVRMGNFELPILPSGTWQLTVTAEDGRRWQGSAVTSVEAPAVVVLP